MKKLTTAAAQNAQLTGAVEQVSQHGIKFDLEKTSIVGPAIIGEPSAHFCKGGAAHKWKTLELLDGKFRILECEVCGGIDDCGIGEEILGICLEKEQSLT